MFLERYFDIAKKFKFETYSVDNSPATAAAIANNGLIEIEFYKEHIPTPSYSTVCTPVYVSPKPWWEWNNIPYYSSGGNSTAGNINFCNSNLSNGNISTSFDTNTGMLRRAKTTRDTNYSSPTSSSASFTNSACNSVTLDSLNFFDLDLERSVSSPLSQQKETGRVEAGSYSNQSFVMDYATYNSWYSSKVTWKILPMSQKPIEASDLKVFCSQCGMKQKKSSWVYCPGCGSKLD